MSEEHTNQADNTEGPVAARRPTGRRKRASSGTREAILLAARSEFAANGFSATSMRAIAARAGVDPALIRYFFGNKESLFIDAVGLPTSTTSTLTASLAGNPDELGARVTDAVLSLWEDPATAEPLTTTFQAAVTFEPARELLREFLTVHVMAQFAPLLGTDRPEVRATIASSFLFGVATSRHVLKVEPIASMDREELIASIAPTIQRLLAEPLA